MQSKHFKLINKVTVVLPEEKLKAMHSTIPGNKCLLHISGQIHCIDFTEFTSEKSWPEDYSVSRR